MLRTGFVCGVLVLSWLADAGMPSDTLPARRPVPPCTGSDEPPERRPVPPLPAGAENLRTPANPDSDYIQIQLLIVELRGDVSRAMKEAGFRETAGNRYIAEMGHPAGRDDDSRAALARKLSQHAEIDVLSRPTVRTVPGQPAHIQIGTAPSPISYLVRTGQKTFELREAAAEANLGITIQLTPHLAGDSDEIEISPLKITTTTLDGREPVAGLDLEVGKPIVSTRTLETALTLPEGATAVAVAAPGPPGRQAVLFLSARRASNAAAEREPERPQPNPR